MPAYGQRRVRRRAALGTRVGGVGPMGEQRRRIHGWASLGPRMGSEVLFFQLGCLNVRIDLRGRDIGMPQHFLDGT